jgi:hypothetical protein
VGGIVSLTIAGKTGAVQGRFLMRRLQLVAHGEPSDIVDLNTVSETTARELYDTMLDLHPDRVNPAALWFSARSNRDAGLAQG